ncbi:hypothetical protein [Lachnospira eligens]|uniref:5-bromo-4-chloroindolyl phosphate hydrolysis protein n=1 Tax=Lachnospira eligens TaxID=39485 RepID=A0A7C9KTG8_9FIRM|nr:hypothetical protein [Lachnospira eligens]MSC55909.1 hypothetical protein [Lachnospira eligens]
MDIIMEVALACVISAGGIGGIIIAVVKLSVASIEKRFERKYTEKFAVFQSDIDKKQYISQVRFDAEFEIYKQLSRKYGELVLQIMVKASNIDKYKLDHMQDKEMGEINYLAYQAVSELYSSAPFIQEDIYNDFLNIYEMSRKLLVQWGEEQRSSTNETKNDVCEANEIYQKYNDTIVKVREYTSKLEGISL